MPRPLVVWVCSNDSGIDFLFSLNRLNVAISRAQALAVLFASARLLDIECSTIEELELVNAFCAMCNYAMRNAE